MDQRMGPPPTRPVLPAGDRVRARHLGLQRGSGPRVAARRCGRRGRGVEAVTAHTPAAPRLQLFPFQRDGVRALVESDALLLADDMGLGKTIQTVAALR